MNEAIFKRCEDMIKQGSSSFYHAFRGLPSPRREAVYVIYAFCRIIDDSVDEPERSPYTIDELRSLFLNLEQAEGHFVWPALRWLFDHFPHLDQGPFLRQMDGQLKDLSLTHYETMEQLEEYCYLVAGTVGEMLLPVLHENSTDRIVASGIALGKGMQIVNIIRDVGEDRGRQRRYLPRELMERFNYSEQDWENGLVNDAFIAMLNELRAQAMNWFRQGLEEMDTYPPASGFAVELASSFYAAILQSVERNGYDVYSKRAFVTDEDKLHMLGNVLHRYPMLGDMSSYTAVS
ncbi:phytoene/squalene synthase family protein [Paenibacillus sp. JX-17]|uniref:Phytoene/squalene synthase family protein n=1 Tax=Paenibacillus lacisoli TaxID=3064525 RepID=A0ABT9CB72_9BACL|nr:phytoene/squalene synthase family protein [Paenibacillus sp. JX-17]MDO7906496.1 phytoene/squalene synthase family protein [Paenibacillus sp. JX-17]